MGTRQPKNRQRSSAAARRLEDSARSGVAAWRLKNNASKLHEELSASLEALCRTTALSKGAAELARQIMLAGAGRLAELGAADVLIGVTTAAMLTALNTGLSRAEFAAWLRHTANKIQGRPHSPPTAQMGPNQAPPQC
jgi:hypothetical protein